MFKRNLEIVNSNLKSEINQLKAEILHLNKIIEIQEDNKKWDDTQLMEYAKLSSAYADLIFKYKELFKACENKETEIVTYNGNLYKISSIDYHKETDAIETINIKAELIKKEKGLIDNLSDAYKDIANSINEIFYGKSEDTK